MEPATLIASLAIAGTGIIAKGVVEEATKTSFTAFMEMLKRKLNGNSTGTTALTKITTEPEAWRAPLQHAIVEAGADQDQELLGLATRLSQQLKSHGAVVAKNNIQIGGNVQGFQAGDGGTQNNTFN